jgi:hypothetical protein
VRPQTRLQPDATYVDSVGVDISLTVQIPVYVRNTFSPRGEVVVSLGFLNRRSAHLRSWRGAPRQSTPRVGSVPSASWGGPHCEDRRLSHATLLLLYGFFSRSTDCPSSPEPCRMVGRARPPQPPFPVLPVPSGRVFNVMVRDLRYVCMCRNVAVNTKQIASHIYATLTVQIPVYVRNTFSPRGEVVVSLGFLNRHSAHLRPWRGAPRQSTPRVGSGLGGKEASAEILRWESPGLPETPLPQDDGGVGHCFVSSS